MSFFKRYQNLLLGAVVTIGLAGFFSVPSMANIMLAPKRIVFDGRARSATLVVLNTSRETRTFQLGWKMVSVDENGTPVNVPLVENEHSVSKMVVFSPRRVTIEPNGRQSVRLSLRRPADLPPGEYRGHLVFITNPGDEDETVRSPKKGVKLALRIGVGMSIPVIVRSGDVTPEGVSIQNVGITADPNGNQSLQMVLAHTAGKGASSYGNLRVYLKGAGEKEETLVASSPNVSLYVEQQRRIIKMTTSRPIPSNSQIRIAYEGADEYRGQTFAEKIIRIK